jgi:hypothetical protein
MCQHSALRAAVCRVADGNRSRGISLSFMEYRGTEYQIVQTANPTGWKWTVQAAGRRVRTGSAFSRVRAIALAQRAIDKLLSATTKRPRGAPPLTERP